MFRALVMLAAWLLANDRRNRYETQIQVGEKKFRALMDTAPEAIVLIDVDSDTFVDVNERAVELFGHPRATLLRMGPTDVSPAVLPTGEIARERMHALMREAMGGAIPVFEWWHTDAGGELVHCEVRLVKLPESGSNLVRGSIFELREAPTVDEPGHTAEPGHREEPDHTAGPGHTEELRHTAEPSVAEGPSHTEEPSHAEEPGHAEEVSHPRAAGHHSPGDAQMRSRKLEAVGELTGGVAHDFNNILTVAMGNLEMMLDLSEEEDEWSDLARDSLTALNRGALLTSRLLAFSRRQPLRPEVLDVGGLVAAMSDPLQRTLGDDIEIEGTIESGLWRCRTDRTQLESAVMNLALNARDAMPEGGVLRIHVGNLRASAWEMEQWFQDAGTLGDPPAVPASRDFVQITVTDNGAGMDPGTLERAFDPFFTTKGVGEGSGLGLSTIYGFVKQSGGHVDIESEVGVGTTLRLRLPRAVEVDDTAPAARDDGAPRVAASEVGRDGRVLLVEDDPGVRNVGVAFLQSMGYTCVSVPDAIEALLLIQKDQAFDLLFTDVILPGGINGIELARRVRVILPELPIVFCSGYSDEMVQGLSEVRGLGPLISKPYTRKDLADVLG